MLCDVLDIVYEVGSVVAHAEAKADELPSMLCTVLDIVDEVGSVVVHAEAVELPIVVSVALGCVDAFACAILDVAQGVANVFVCFSEQVLACLSQPPPCGVVPAGQNRRLSGGLQPAGQYLCTSRSLLSLAVYWRNSPVRSQTFRGASGAVTACEGFQRLRLLTMSEAALHQWDHLRYM